MGESRSQFLWGHTSAVLAMLANIHRDAKRSRTFKPADFNPHAKSPKPIHEKAGIEILKQVFVDRVGGA